jgi:hypothetical protein
MGAWGAGNFQNDAALDWLGDLQESGDLDQVRSALMEIIDSDPEDLDPDDCCAALAAAEAVAALRGKAHPEPPENLSSWVAAHPQAPDRMLVDLAKSAVRKLSAKSELRDLWEEGEFKDWFAAVEDVVRRLG